MNKIFISLVASIAAMPALAQGDPAVAAKAGDTRAKPWRAMHDRTPIDIEEGEEA